MMNRLGAFSLLVLFACGSYDGVERPSSANDPTATSDAAPPADAGARVVDARSPSDASADATADAATCTADLKTSSEHCGKCGHSCGAGACSAGTCQPFAVATGFTEVVAIDMSPSGIVIGADNDIKRCEAAAGCTPATLKAIASGQSFLEDLAVAGTDVYFHVDGSDPHFVYKCPVSGCVGGQPELVNV